MLIWHVTTDLDAGITLVMFHGELATTNKHVFRSTVLDCLAEQPLAVVVDLAEVVDRTTGAVPAMLLALHREAAREPVVPLLWCAPTGELAEQLSRSRWRDLLRIYDTRRQALDAAMQPPSSPRIHARLHADPFAASIARNLVFDACRSWGLPDIAYRARWVISELATNAVEHARTDLDVSAALRGRMVHLAVRDRSRARPVRRDPSAFDPRQPLAHQGLGLSIVDNAAVAWGCLTADDGKVVWALLLIPGAVSRP